MDPLKVFCETILTTEFSVDPLDSTTLYLFAEEHGCVSFKRVCLKVMQTHSSIAMESEDFELLPEEIQTRLQRIKEGKKVSSNKPKKGCTNNNNNQKNNTSKNPVDAVGNILKKGDKVQVYCSVSPADNRRSTFTATPLKDGWSKQVGIIMGFKEGFIHVALTVTQYYYHSTSCPAPSYRSQHVRLVTVHSPEFVYV